MFWKLSACFVGTAAGVVVFLCGADRLAQLKEKPPVVVNTPLAEQLLQQNAELRQLYFKAISDRADLEGRFEDLAGQRDRERSRAFAAECRAERAEGEAITLRALLDAARRYEGKVIPAGTAPGDRIPPQNVPVPVP